MVSAGYILVMAMAGLIARKITAREMRALTGEEVEALMVGPVPLTPLMRSVVVAQKGHYRAAEFRWFRRPHVDPASLRAYPRGRPPGAAVDAAVATPLGTRFLSWARFPVIEVDSEPDGSTLVHMIDLRYADRPGAGFGSVTIAVPAPTAASPLPPQGR
jgi:hypothetical protein